MRILVTGAGGFVGRHLIRELAQAGHAAWAFDQQFSIPVTEAAENFTGDLRNGETVRRIVASARPDACVHLGAISFVPAGDLNPDVMLSVNVLGTVNLLEALRELAHSSRILVISTAQVYGPAQSDKPIRESAPISPVNIYAISKAAADITTLAYASQYGMHAMTARPSNHTGPGQSAQFVVSSFARQVKAISKGKSDTPLKVGNLESERNFMDVRDVARAYRLLVEKGQGGHAYNISSRNRVKIAAVLNELCELANISPDFTIDPDKFRPTDRLSVLDITRIHKDTGWEAEISLTKTLQDILSEF